MAPDYGSTGEVFNVKYSRSVFERIFEFASVGAGLAIVGACSYAGYAEGPGFGILLGLASLIVAAVVVSAVFIVTRTSADVRAIRKQLDQLQPPDEDVKVHDQN